MNNTEINSNQFDDSTFAADKVAITKVILRTGWVVDGVQFEYDSKYLTAYHGSESGALQELKLGKGEWIVGVEYETADYAYATSPVVCSIKFTTNKKNVLKGGTKQDCKNIVKHTIGYADNMKLFAFKGSYGGYLVSFEDSLKKSS